MKIFFSSSGEKKKNILLINPPLPKPTPSRKKNNFSYSSLSFGEERRRKVGLEAAVPLFEQKKREYFSFSWKKKEKEKYK